MKQKIIPKPEYDDYDDDSRSVDLDELMEVGDIKEETPSESGYDSDVSGQKMFNIL